MNEILIQDDNQPELRFRGQLISESDFEVELEDEQTRKFKLRVFAVEGGGFVATLNYDTTSEYENPVVHFENMDLFKDVENFFFVFEANEVIRDLNRIGRPEREQRMAAYKRIAKVYETSMFKFLDDVRNRARQQKFGDRVVEKVEKPSLLKSLGLKR